MVRAKDSSNVTTNAAKQEVNPGLADAESVRMTVNVGCSLVRSALGWLFLDYTGSEVLTANSGETLL